MNGVDQKKSAIVFSEVLAPVIEQALTSEDDKDKASEIVANKVASKIIQQRFT